MPRRGLPFSFSQCPGIYGEAADLRAGQPEPPHPDTAAPADTQAINTSCRRLGLQEKTLAFFSGLQEPYPNPYFTLVPLRPMGQGKGKGKYCGRKHSTAWHISSTGNYHPSPGFLGPGSRRVVTNSRLNQLHVPRPWATAKHRPVRSCSSHWPPL